MSLASLRRAELLAHVEKCCAAATTNNAAFASLKRPAFPPAFVVDEDLSATVLSYDDHEDETKASNEDDFLLQIEHCAMGGAALAPPLPSTEDEHHLPRASIIRWADEDLKDLSPAALEAAAARLLPNTPSSSLKRHTTSAATPPAILLGRSLTETWHYDVEEGAPYIVTLTVILLHPNLPSCEFCTIEFTNDEDNEQRGDENRQWTVQDLLDKLPLYATGRDYQTVSYAVLMQQQDNANGSASFMRLPSTLTLPSLGLPARATVWALPAQGNAIQLQQRATAIIQAPRFQRLLRKVRLDGRNIVRLDDDDEEILRQRQWHQQEEHALLLSKVQQRHRSNGSSGVPNKTPSRRRRQWPPQLFLRHPGRVRQDYTSLSKSPLWGLLDLDHAMDEAIYRRISI